MMSPLTSIIVKNIFSRIMNTCWATVFIYRTRDNFLLKNVFTPLKFFLMLVLNYCSVLQKISCDIKVASIIVRFPKFNMLDQWHVSWMISLNSVTPSELQQYLLHNCIFGSLWFLKETSHPSFLRYSNQLHEYFYGFSWHWTLRQSVSQFHW